MVGLIGFCHKRVVADLCSVVCMSQIGSASFQGSARWCSLQGQSQNCMVHGSIVFSMCIRIGAVHGSSSCSVLATLAQIAGSP
jgi:hypothetical protein